MKAFAMGKKSKAITLLMGALVMTAVYGCGDDDDPLEQNDARIRAIHLSADAPDVDIYADETPPAAVTDLPFGESTDFLDIDPGTYTFNITVAGDPPPPPSVLDVGPLSLAAGKAYTAVAFDEVASLQALALIDDLSSPGAGNIRLRAIHAAPDVGQVDIWEVSDAMNPLLLYENVDFGVAGDYLPPLPAGSYTIGFDTNNDQVPDLTFVTPALAAGSILNVFAVSDGVDVFLIAQFQDGTTARIDPI